MAFIILSCASQAIPQLYRLLRHDSSRMSAKERGHKELGMAAVVNHLLRIMAPLTAGASAGES